MSVINKFNFYMPVEVHFGEGELDEVGKIIKDLSRKAFLVTGRTSMRKLGITDRVVKLLKDNSVDVVLYNNISPNPTVKMVDEGARIAREQNCDLVVGLGGGSVLDAAKGIAVVASHGGSVWNYIGEGKVTEKTLPIIGIPTTAGTGSEVTPYSVFTNEKIHRKDAINSPHTFPKIAIVDPLLMRSMSPELTTDTGFDALAHAIESYLSTNVNPFSDMLATEAITLINNSLVKAIENGDDLAARANMALASSLAGMAIAQAGVVAGHGFGMSIGGLLGTSHGRTVGVLLPHIISHNLPQASDRIAQLAGCFNISRTGDTMEDAQRVIDAITKMMAQANFPSSLKAIGVDTEDIKRIAEDCMDRADMRNNPRKYNLRDAREFLSSIL